MSVAAAEEPSDDELARRLLDDPEHRDGEAYLLMYARHRNSVRATMVRAGLDLESAERSVGMVFDRFLDLRESYPPEMQLREWLKQIAIDVATATRTTAPGGRVAERRVRDDGFFGSGL